MITDTEIASATDRFNFLQRKAYNGGLTQAERDEWKRTSFRMRSEGYSLHKRKQHVDGYGKISVWRLVKDSETARNNECPYEFTNVRPDRKTLQGDCTTRAMTFCLRGIMTYDEIEAEQYRLASMFRTRRNTIITWEQLIMEHGYVKMMLPNRVKRSRLAAIIGKAITAPVISLSAGHVAVIDCGGVVRDTWDSRGGKVKAIYLKEEDLVNVGSTLMNNGIEL